MATVDTMVGYASGAISVGNTVGGVSREFIVYPQPADQSTLATFNKSADDITLAYKIIDKTVYTEEQRSSAKFSVNLLIAIRELFTSTDSTVVNSILQLGQWITLGANNSSQVTKIQISVPNEATPDVFLAQLAIEESITTTTSSSQGEDAPRASKSQELAPWEKPPSISFTGQSVDGKTTGFAMSTADLDGTKAFSSKELLDNGVSTDDKKWTQMCNTAGDPFSSPPAMPSSRGTLTISRAYLYGDSENSANLTKVTTEAINRVNIEDITVKASGFSFDFPKNSLMLTSCSATRETWEKPYPWYSKTKHPLKKTYSELFYGYSGKTGSKVAYNATSETIVVTQPLCYMRVSATFEFRPEGFGIWLANRGYREINKDSGKLKECRTSGVGSTCESWLDKDGAMTTTDKIWKGYTFHLSDWKVSFLLDFLLKDDLNPIPWAEKTDSSLDASNK